MLEVCNLQCVRGNQSLFSALNFRLTGGEMLHLKGRNGSGKTSLLRLLCGLAAPDNGEIRWRSQAIKQLGEDYRRELLYLGHHNSIKAELSPLENLCLAAKLSGQTFSQQKTLAALAEVGLAGREDLLSRYLSQGQKRRVALARLFVEQRLLWLLDEPYVGLDSAAVTRLAELMAQHLQQGGVLILTTHQAVTIPGVKTRELVLETLPHASSLH